MLLALIFWSVASTLVSFAVNFLVDQNRFCKSQTRVKLLTVICLVVASTFRQLGQFLLKVTNINFALIPTASSSYAISINFLVRYINTLSVLRSIFLMTKTDFALIQTADSS